MPKRSFTILMLAGLLTLLPVIVRASVTLARFEGWWDNGTVMLEWETASEINHAGFNLYRHTQNLPLDQVTSQATLLNNSIIIEGTQGITACTTNGNVYQFTDTTADPAQGVYHYWLESYPCDAGPPIIESGAHLCVLFGDYVGGDGKVTVADVQHLAGLWHQTASAPDDTDGDGKITIIDITRVATRLGNTC